MAGVKIENIPEYQSHQECSSQNEDELYRMANGSQSGAKNTLFKKIYSNAFIQADKDA